MNIGSALISIKSLFKRQRDYVRTPAILQMEAVECGAAALAIILAYYGRIVPLAELRSECGVSRDGSKASNILKAARFYGLEAKGFKKPLQKLTEFKPPYIVFWNFNHFLVVEGFTKKKDYVYLNDPASGRRKITLDEFDNAYTGVVLVMEPGPNFQKGGKKKSTFAQAASRLETSQSAIIFCLLAGLLLTIPRLAVPGFTKVFVDEILIANRQEWLRPLIVGMTLTAAVQILLAQMRFLYLRRLMVKLSIAMSGNYVWHTLRLPIGFYAQRFTGEISSRNDLNDKVANILSGRLATTVIDTVMIVFYAMIMFSYDGRLTTLAILFAALNFLALQFLSRTRIDANMKIAQENGKVAGVAIGGIQSIETVKASGLESDLFAKFSGYYAKMLNAQQEMALPTQILSNLPIFLTSLATTSILVYGGFRVMDGYLSIGSLVAFQSLTRQFLRPVYNLVGFGSTLQEIEADLNRLDDVLENPLDPES